MYMAFVKGVRRLERVSNIVSTYKVELCNLSIGSNTTTLPIPVTIASLLLLPYSKYEGKMATVYMRQSHSETFYSSLLFYDVNKTRRYYSLERRLLMVCCFGLRGKDVNYAIDVIPQHRTIIVFGLYMLSTRRTIFYSIM